MVTIDYAQFCRLVSSGQSEAVIFKLESNALQNMTADNGELARDIIALANHHGHIGYIMLGVSERREFKSVTNSNLTEEGLRAFCQAAIFPEPIISLIRLNLGNEGVVPEHQGKTFVVIQVGPQSVGVFRFHQNFIDLGTGTCFRKNEVWVRRQTVSAPASPEEIKGLFENNTISASFNAVENKDAHSGEQEVTASLVGITRIPQNYTRIPWERTFPSILKEIARLARKVGGRLYSSEDPFNIETAPIHHLVLPLNENPLIFRVIITHKCEGRNLVREYLGRYLTFEHGIFLISVGDVEAETLEVSHFRRHQSWGWFFTAPFGGPGFKDSNFQVCLPIHIMKQLDPIEISGIVLANIQTDQHLPQLWDEMMRTLKEDATVKQALDLSYNKILTALSFYLKEGCLRPASKNIIPKKLLANEIYDPQQYGEVLMIKQPQVYDAIITMLKKLKL